MKKIVHYYKYGNKTAFRHYLASLIINFVKDYSINVGKHDVLLPVPLHATRLRERGYNQALFLAQILSHEFNIPIQKDVLGRKRHTSNQARLSQKERWTNIRGAFKIKDSQKIIGKKLLIVDDLYTTGATVSEAAKTLKDAGAKEINVITAAIAH